MSLVLVDDNDAASASVVGKDRGGAGRGLFMQNGRGRGWDGVSKIKTILSIIFRSIYGVLCLQFTQFSCDDHENVYFILLSSSNRKYE